MLERLHAAVAAVAPIFGVAIISPGVGRVDVRPEATAPERAAAAAALAAFDWSDGAQAAWELLRDRASAQSKWDDRSEKLFRAFVLVVLDEINILRGAHSLPARTVGQLKTAALGKINAGSAD